MITEQSIKIAAYKFLNKKMADAFTRQSKKGLGKLIKERKVAKANKLRKSFSGSSEGLSEFLKERTTKAEVTSILKEASAMKVLGKIPKYMGKSVKNPKIKKFNTEYVTQLLTRKKKIPYTEAKSLAEGAAALKNFGMSIK